MRKANIADVALRAGVSTKSVSRVLNDEPNVRPQMRAKIEEAIEALGYKPDLAARSLSSGRSFIIGLLFDNPSPNYTMKVLQGTLDACHQAGYQLVIENVDTASPTIGQAMEAMLQHRRMDGMVVTPPATDSPAVLDALERANLPYVRIAPNKFPGRSMTVSADDQAAVSDVVRHLWNLGHRRFGFVGGPASHGASMWRHDGFFAALAERGVEPGEIQEAEGDFTFTSGIGAGRQLLRAEPRLTAIFAANDDMAAGIFTAAAQLGIKIPDMLSVVGFDDSWIAKSVWPELTTMHQPIAEMAHIAVRTLIASRNGKAVKEPAPQNCHLIVRGSAGPVGQ
ncbi:LacI family DNA-binding transcriptional regulator [Sphingobium nicotianae]|uniref:LacI family DNA-binding transcriptional regulator n=1 Tax=Sphingobium nicotianae TaxID=2782607 RepID=A0A9X1D9Z8_9SPHN|nr:LacI family DNA-binding transcriptional regulator [Sphingobium nicotianae]MBT2186096.1 LacI family DNA-binding transcriptional regulator [Sphingobium nicotianae]